MGKRDRQVLSFVLARRHRMCAAVGRATPTGIQLKPSLYMSVMCVRFGGSTLNTVRKLVISVVRTEDNVATGSDVARRRRCLHVRRCCLLQVRHSVSSLLT